jgi:hypothetical protein
VTPYLYQITGGTTVLKFDFPGINLDDKTVPERNKGQVRFSIDMKSGLPEGTVVSNRAGIYFDGNPVVLTNYSYSTIPGSAGVPGAGAVNGLRIYPNPASDAIRISVRQSGWTEAVLSNAIGQTVARMPLNAGENVLQVQGLPAGIYYLHAKGSAGSRTEKIEKQ